MLLASPALALNEACVDECQKVCSISNSLCIMVYEPTACANVQAQCEEGCPERCSCLNGCANVCPKTIKPDDYKESDVHMSKTGSVSCMERCPSTCSVVMGQMFVESAAHSDNEILAQAAQTAKQVSQQSQVMMNAVVSQIQVAEEAYTQNVMKILTYCTTSDDQDISKTAEMFINNFIGAQEYQQKYVEHDE